MQEASSRPGKVTNLVHTLAYTGTCSPLQISRTDLHLHRLLCAVPEVVQIRRQTISIVAIVIISVAVVIDITPIIAIATVVIGRGTEHDLLKKLLLFIK